MTSQMIEMDTFRTFEAHGWEQKAGPYHRFFGPITDRVADPLFDAARVGKRSRVLDIATGPGYVAADARNRGANVTGIDIAGAMVDLAKELHPDIEFLQGDAECLPFGAGSFDAVAGSFILPHLGQPEQAVAECARVLAPGGWLAVSMWDIPEHNRLFGVLTEAFANAGATSPPNVPSGPPFFHYAADATLSALLASAGFEDVAIQRLAFPHRFSGPDELWHGLVSGTVRMAALVTGQPERIQRRIRAGFNKRVSGLVASGALEFPIVVKIASGRKATAIAQVVSLE